MSLSASDELDLINTAIADIYANGQTYALGGRAHSRADLALLLSRKKELEQTVATQTYGRARNFVRFDRPA